MIARPDPAYDLQSVLPAGVVMTRAINDALHAAYANGGNVRLTAGQVLAITGPAPTYPTGLPRLPK